jgi:hypothetical protein
MSQSPWSSYGRLPPKPEGATNADKQSPISGVVRDVMRGREQLDNYLNGVLREFFEIRSGSTGYKHIIEGALSPSTRPETIEERLTRLAREAQMRRSGRSPTSRPR